MTRYLGLKQVLRIHSVMLARHGGATGVRDLGLLEAAVARPQNGYYADLFEEAAASWESLSQNHPFVDGNKRAAFGSMDIFLRVNGYELDHDEDQSYQEIIAMYESGTFRFEVLVEWIRERARVKA